MVMATTTPDLFVRSRPQEPFAHVGYELIHRVALRQVDIKARIGQRVVRAATNPLAHDGVDFVHADLLQRITDSAIPAALFVGNYRDFVLIPADIHEGEELGRANIADAPGMQAVI